MFSLPPGVVHVVSKTKPVEVTAMLNIKIYSISLNLRVNKGKCTFYSALLVNMVNNFIIHLSLCSAYMLRGQGRYTVNFLLGTLRRKVGTTVLSR